MREKSFLLEVPSDALEIAEICEGTLGMATAADSIYEDLERDAMQAQITDRHPYRYIFLDLAEWRRRRGERERCQALLEKARGMPGMDRDPRTFDYAYCWRFTDEPDVPNDAFRVAHAEQAAVA